MRDVATALIQGTDPPSPIHAVTPALACYPERRDGVEYSRAEIHRLAAYLRSRYAFVVVDMSNRLPDPTAGPEAAVASFWLEEADALVLPTGSSRQDFNGVLDYLDVPNLPPTVVPYIASSARRNRRHPVTRHYLDTIGPRVQALVEIPDEADSVRFAGMEGSPGPRRVAEDARCVHRADRGGRPAAQGCADVSRGRSLLRRSARGEVDGRRAERVTRVLELVERFVFDLGLVIAGEPVDLADYVAAGPAARRPRGGASRARQRGAHAPRLRRVRAGADRGRPARPARVRCARGGGVRRSLDATRRGRLRRRSTRDAGCGFNCSSTAVSRSVLDHRVEVMPLSARAHHA